VTIIPDYAYRWPLAYRSSSILPPVVYYPSEVAAVTYSCSPPFSVYLPQSVLGYGYLPTFETDLGLGVAAAETPADEAPFEESTVGAAPETEAGEGPAYDPGEMVYQWPQGDWVWLCPTAGYGE